MYRQSSIHQDLAGAQRTVIYLFRELALRDAHIEHLKDCNLKLVVDGARASQRACRAEEIVRGHRRVVSAGLAVLACIVVGAYVSALRVPDYMAGAGGGSSVCETTESPSEKPADLPQDLPEPAYPGACMLLSSNQRDTIEDSLQMSIVCDRSAFDRALDAVRVPRPRAMNPFFAL